MSTRAQIRFTDKAGTVQVYKHSDGYPEGVVRLLDTVLTVQDATGTTRDATYTAANVIFVGKLQGMQLYVNGMRNGDLTDVDLKELVDDPEGALKHLKQPHFLLGFGVENPADGTHGDEAWLYEYDTHLGRLRVYSARERGWDGQPEFEGSIGEAADEYL